MSNTLFKIQHYRKSRDHPIMGIRRSMLVFAENEQDALDYVKNNVEKFDGFPWDHESAKVVTELNWHKA